MIGAFVGALIGMFLFGVIAHDWNPPDALMGMGAILAVGIISLVLGAVLEAAVKFNLKHRIEWK